MRVRLGNVEDCERVQEIWWQEQNYLGMGASVAFLKDIRTWARKRRLLLSETDDGVVRGFLGFTPHRDHRFALTSLGVDEQVHGQGHAEALYVGTFVYLLSCGRFQIEDHIPDGNYFMPPWLSGLKFTRGITFRQRMKSHRDLQYWYFNLNEVVLEDVPWVNKILESGWEFKDCLPEENSPVTDLSVYDGNPLLDQDPSSPFTLNLEWLKRVVDDVPTLD